MSVTDLKPVTDPPAHRALFYRGAAEYLTGVVPFVEAGLALGEPVLVAVPAPGLRLLGDELDESAGDVCLVDMAETGRNPGRIIPKVLRTFSDAHPDGRVRVVAGLVRDRAVDVELVVAEMAANTLVHGGGRGTLRLWIEDAHLVCEVRDTGHITDPLVGRRPVGPEEAGGRGVLLVNQVSDLVRLHTGPDGTTMRAYFTLQG